MNTGAEGEYKRVHGDQRRENFAASSVCSENLLTVQFERVTRHPEVGIFGVKLTGNARPVDVAEMGTP